MEPVREILSGNRDEIIDRWARQLSAASVEKSPGISMDEQRFARLAHELHDSMTAARLSLDLLR